MLVINIFPNHNIDQTIKNFLFGKFANTDLDSSLYETNRTTKPTVNAETCDDETAKMVYENQMTKSYKQKEFAHL